MTIRHKTSKSEAAWHSTDNDEASSDEGSDHQEDILDHDNTIDTSSGMLADVITIRKASKEVETNINQLLEAEASYY